MHSGCLLTALSAGLTAGDRTWRGYGLETRKPGAYHDDDHQRRPRDDFVSSAFKREWLRVLNHAEAVNARKRALYTGRVAGCQAKREEQMQAVADALSLLANSVIACNTARMQAVIDSWSEPVPAELMGCIAPTRSEGINLRGIFRFPIERFAERRLPSHTARTTAMSG